MSAFLSIVASSASLFMILVTVLVVPAQRATEMLKVRLFTSRPMNLDLVWLRLTSSISPAPRLRQKSMINSIGLTNDVALDRLDIVYLKRRGIECSSLILLYTSQVSVLVASGGKHFFNRSTEHNNALFINTLKTWLADHNMPRHMWNVLVEHFTLIQTVILLCYDKQNNQCLWG